MSYDINLFQLREGVSVEEINACFESGAHRAYRDETVETGTVRPIIPERFFNTDFELEALKLAVFKACQEATIPEGMRTEAQRLFLNSAETDAPEEWPEEWEEDFEWMFEYADATGLLPLCFGYGDELGKRLQAVAQVLEDYSSLRIVAFDGQIERVLDGRNARAMFITLAEAAMKRHNGLGQALLSGEFPPINLSVINKPDDNDGNE